MAVGGGRLGRGVRPAGGGLDGRELSRHAKNAAWALGHQPSTGRNPQVLAQGTLIVHWINVELNIYVNLSL